MSKDKGTKKGKGAQNLLIIGGVVLGGLALWQLLKGGGGFRDLFGGARAPGTVWSPDTVPPAELGYIPMELVVTPGGTSIPVGAAPYFAAVTPYIRRPPSVAAAERPAEASVAYIAEALYTPTGQPRQGGYLMAVNEAMRAAYLGA